MRLLGCLGWRMAVVLLAIAVLFFLSLHSNMFPKDTTKLRLNDLLSKACGKAQPLFTALLQEQCENFSTDGSNAAFIVETRKHNKLPLVLANLAGILPDWTLYLMHGDENSMYVQSLPVVERLQKTGQIHLITLQNVSKLFQDETYELSRGAYNCLLRTRAFWSCSRAEHVLIFQSDSILCAGSPYSVDDFLEYDYIGAPWPEGKVGNGGLSLRRRQAMLELIENKAAWSVPEDLYFTIGINRSKRFRVAPVELAQRFSTDRVYEESVGTPFGVHQPSSLQFGDSKKLLQSCPEAKALDTPWSVSTLYNRNLYFYIYWIQHHLLVTAIGTVGCLILLLWQRGLFAMGCTGKVQSA